MSTPPSGSAEGSALTANHLDMQILSQLDGSCRQDTSRSEAQCELGSIRHWMGFQATQFNRPDDPFKFTAGTIRLKFRESRIDNTQVRQNLQPEVNSASYLTRDKRKRNCNAPKELVKSTTLRLVSFSPTVGLFFSTTALAENSSL